MSEEESFSQAQVDEMLKDATKKANGEAASNRVALKDLQEQFAEIETDREKKAQEALAKQGEFQSLYESSQTKLEELNATSTAQVEVIQNYEARDKKELESLLETVTDDFKGLITEDLPLAKRLEMARAFSKQANTTAPNVKLGGKGGQPPDLETRIKSCTSLSELKKLQAEEEMKRRRNA